MHKESWSQKLLNENVEKASSSSEVAKSSPRLSVDLLCISLLVASPPWSILEGKKTWIPHERRQRTAFPWSSSRARTHRGARGRKFFTMMSAVSVKPSAIRDATFSATWFGLEQKGKGTEWWEPRVSAESSRKWAQRDVRVTLGVCKQEQDKGADGTADRRLCSTQTGALLGLGMALESTFCGLLLLPPHQRLCPGRHLKKKLNFLPSLHWKFVQNQITFENLYHLSKWQSLCSAT